jgi:transposase
MLIEQYQNAGMSRAEARRIALEKLGHPEHVRESHREQRGMPRLEVLDNLSAHKTKAVDEFLQANPKVRFHFTPTYSSWLNQVEIWFSKIERNVIARGVFTSVADLARKLRKYIRACAKSARPFRWTYTDAHRRIRPAVTI